MAMIDVVRGLGGVLPTKEDANPDPHCIQINPLPQCRYSIELSSQIKREREREKLLGVV